MKKKRKERKLSRKSNQRKALLRSLARELFLKERITTTEAKAKEVSSFAEKQITKGKTESLHAKRLLRKNFSSEVSKKIIEKIAPKYKDREGGYTRVIKLGPRISDGARMAIIELVK